MLKWTNYLDWNIDNDLWPHAECGPTEQPFHFLQQTMMSLDERLCAAQPAASTSGEMRYGEPQDAPEDMNLVNQWMDSPAFLEMLSDPTFMSSLISGFDQGTEANSAFSNMDGTLNPNFASYTQDFSHYSDLQFNRLVNESQSLQSEAQDGGVQVKLEDELWRGPTLGSPSTVSLSSLSSLKENPV